jgi:HAD superfamily hydrolase (TIGR01549 family)
MPQLKTIFFDVGNTLLFPVRPVVIAPLYQRNVIATLEQWHAVERVIKTKFDALLERGPVDHGFWFMFYSQLLAELGIKDGALRDQMVTATQISANWGDMLPGTLESLERIGSRYALGVISNADGKIRAVLERCGIAGCFRSITDSGIVGCEKPAAAIFQAALRSMNAQPEHSLYVGDFYSVDYLGATRAGMQAILFDVSGAYRGSGVPRVESLSELEARLVKLSLLSS